MGDSFGAEDCPRPAPPSEGRFHFKKTEVFRGAPLRIEYVYVLCPLYRKQIFTIP